MYVDRVDGIEGEWPTCLETAPAPLRHPKRADRHLLVRRRRHGEANVEVDVGVEARRNESREFITEWKEAQGDPNDVAFQRSLTVSQRSLTEIPTFNQSRQRDEKAQLEGDGALTAKTASPHSPRQS